MYILQESLFSFEELQKIESKERLPIFFSALDLRPYAKELRNPSPRGAHVNDGDEGPALMTLAAARSKAKFFMLDAGYDQMKNYEAARNVKAQAIIPLNPRNEKEPPAGMTRKGTPCCSMGFPMTYWGQEKVHLKFRCPHATGQVDCPLGMAACSSSNYGMVVKVNSQTDLRRYALPHRESRGWKELYNKRTRVERCNSRMKTYLTADQLHVWGIQKVTTHQYLNAIVLLASALAIARQQVQNAA
nr:transposase [Paenibacillus sp. P3E]